LVCPANKYGSPASIKPFAMYPGLTVPDGALAGAIDGHVAER
jgi:hypothetical protein